MIEAIQFTKNVPTGRSAAARLKDEMRHFEICPMCSQAVDRRDIYAVMHHLPVGHLPIPVN